MECWSSDILAEQRRRTAGLSSSERCPVYLRYAAALKRRPQIVLWQIRLDTICVFCYSLLITNEEAAPMVIEIDFQSDEAIYLQLRNQIILGIATSMLREGDVLPSVRQLADDIGINMHTVNKAYSVLRQEGFVTIDRRKGAVISLDVDKNQALAEMKQNLRVVLAKASCKNISRQEVHCLVDEIFSEYETV